MVAVQPFLRAYMGFQGACPLMPFLRLFFAARQRIGITITERAEAIRTAVMLAGAGDIILVAGKGHETYQIIGTEKHHFDDREELSRAFETLNK